MSRVAATKNDQNGLIQNIYPKIGYRPGKEKVKAIVEQPADKTVLLLKTDMFGTCHQGTDWCFMIYLPGYHEGSHM